MLGNHEALWTLWEVSRAGTHAAAAARLGITASAVGQQLKALERHAGVALFERVGRRARLTAAGAALVQRLGEHLPALDAALEEASEAQRAVRGAVSLGGPWPFFRHLLRPRLPGLLERHPALQLDVRFDVPSRVARRLLDGELDLGIIGLLPEAPGLEVRAVAQEQFLAVASPTYLKHRGTPRSARDFAAHRFIAFDADLAMLAPWWRAAFGPKESLPAQVLCRIANLDEMQALAEAGMGLTVLPDYLVEASVREGRLVVLTPESPRRSTRQPRGTLWVAWRKTAAPTARFLAVRDWLLDGTGRP
ncbi:LysR family transcriptional regulator [Comamonas sp. JC664]|uniref:LysR family transcriptional regulator n=1 Tax=Comamonas sp. JC664 TaxID=2801917 RepID=UPI00174E59A7|nr:LysR family transcriptional regulator [Comamonas sp. JC664]MBL0697970.1 LysR family transcriptional regulator [Comamonas sp. JC664]GHG70605.1 LysR family transcriptional regulator [Comamonas sp. KCTC 72670]